MDAKYLIYGLGGVVCFGLTFIAFRQFSGFSEEARKATGETQGIMSGRAKDPKITHPDAPTPHAPTQTPAADSKLN